MLWLQDGSSKSDSSSDDVTATTSYDDGKDAPAAAAAAIGSFRERAKYIPLRLKLEDRRLLRLLEAALHVSEYTDKVSHAGTTAATECCVSMTVYCMLPL